MEHNTVIQSLMVECISPSGFLGQLRAGVFDRTRYNALVEALSNYAAIVQDKETVDRTVAYCLYQIEIESSAALSYYPRDSNDVQTIQDAYYKLTSLIVDIVTPPYMFEPLPEWLDKKGDTYELGRGSLAAVLAAQPADPNFDLQAWNEAWARVEAEMARIEAEDAIGDEMP